jgi:hypothetical protein
MAFTQYVFTFLHLGTRYYGRAEHPSYLESGLY